MNRYWENLMQPILDITKAKTIVEIGAQKGINTRKILEYCTENGGKLYTVDPLKIPEYDIWTEENGEHFEFLQELSLNALPKIEDYDAILIDGDHNWYTVYNELKIVEKNFKGKNKFPIIFAHDIGWPYGRRDLYYTPENIPPYYQQAYKKLGMLPNKNELVEKNGLNGHLFNAIYENNNKNGVLTAIEDFIQETSLDLELEKIHGFHGLGIIYEKNDKNRKITEFISSRSFQDSLSMKLEGERLTYLIKTNNLSIKIRELEEIKNKTAREKERLLEISKEMDVLNEKLRNLSQEKDNLSGKLEAVSTEKNTLKNKINNLEVVNKEQTKKYNLVTEELRNMRQDLKKQSRETEKVYDSIKYNLGDLLISSVKSPKNLLALPYRLLKLSKRAVSKNKSTTVKEKKNNKTFRKLNFHNKKFDKTLFYKVVDDINKENPKGNFYKILQDSESQLKEITRYIENEPLVTIIMPTYNRANVIGQAIQSIVEQSYTNWELIICDDGSRDKTEEEVKRFKDERIKYHKLDWGGAAKARNYGLSVSKGEYIAYLDSDNVWHPLYLTANIGRLLANPGYYSVFNRYIDVYYYDNKYKIKTCKSLTFDYEKLMEKNFIDLNSFVHRRELYDHFGGFNNDLVRRQDWDLVLKYTFLRNPLYGDQLLVIYRRNENWGQISNLQSNDHQSLSTIQANVSSYFENGLPALKPSVDLPKITIISWDVSRNHFSKAYNIAESLSSFYTVQLLGFRFFDEKIFPPYENEVPNFEMTILEGKEFPDFFKMMSEALTKINGDVVYAIKPRLSSLGLALLANYHLSKPLILEYNDLETVVSSPQKDKELQKKFKLEEVDFTDKELQVPYSLQWSKIMEELSHKVPVTTTHNKTLDQFFGGKSFYIRNLKDESYYDPDKYNRDEVREELGYTKDDRVILFGGLIRKHKGIYELVDLIDRLNDQRYKLLFVGSRETPDQKKLMDKYGDRIKVLPPQGRNEMAKINYASDLVILWLDPSIPASHYQMPYKFTDAIAMKVPVIANDISDLGDLARSGYLKLAKHGDFDELMYAIKDVFDNPMKTKEIVDKARSLYIRQFSYKAVKSNLDLIFDVAKKQENTLDVANEFVDFMSNYYKQYKN
ncbi:glycosyltransferase [Evansella cellulosilytica]|uniref:Glycosyl transferase family 2 n=1 Tax=Evansella cellulosilytica (strain ATCC 21833 / DSM 2522 / FERM P-1141 / JCM 9156 / N-4) TaxID=649639 RepID=E6TSB5_EVAC2|nr:glycosyltransferase [Evansella cellulosilytica]ADU31884.1 glycosyl transferase family 2 [Evansella cellulosilytica DSM 2522]